MIEQDLGATLLEQVNQARDHGHQLYIRGGNSKRHLLGRSCEAVELDVSGHSGIVDYQPGELVVTARAGTSLSQLAHIVALERQVLPFEPPVLAGRATLGGTLACNLSGPARPWQGSIRDAVLGVQLINGRGELLNFGGQVMKNVAGYDVSRLQAGALGTLGLVTQVTLKLLPAPETSATLAYDMSLAEAMATMQRRGVEPKPLTGAMWTEGRLYLRLSGAASAVAETARRWGGDQGAALNGIWEALREWQLPAFGSTQPLWRLSLRNNAELPGLEPALVDWGGTQRWLTGEQDAGEIHRAAQAAGGHATLFRGGNRAGEVRGDAGPVARRIQQRLKHALDPQGLFNPGRLYSWL